MNKDSEDLVKPVHFAITDLKIDQPKDIPERKSSDSKKAKLKQTAIQKFQMQLTNFNKELGKKFGSELTYGTLSIPIRIK